MKSDTIGYINHHKRWDWPSEKIAGSATFWYVKQQKAFQGTIGTRPYFHEFLGHSWSINGPLMDRKMDPV